MIKDRHLRFLGGESDSCSRAYMTVKTRLWFSLNEGQGKGVGEDERLKL